MNVPLSITSLTQVLVEHQTRTREELRVSQEGQLQELAHGLEKEAVAEEMRLAANLEQVKQKALSERKQRLHAKMEGQTNSEENKQQVTYTDNWSDFYFRSSSSKRADNTCSIHNFISHYS